MLQMNLITQKELYAGLYGEVYRGLYWGVDRETWREVYWELWREFYRELYQPLGSQIRTNFSHSKISRV
jgi:hypothetical protein